MRNLFIILLNPCIKYRLFLCLLAMMTLLPTISMAKKNNYRINKMQQKIKQQQDEIDLLKLKLTQQQQNPARQADQRATSYDTASTKSAGCAHGKCQHQLFPNAISFP